MPSLLNIEQLRVQRKSCSSLYRSHTVDSYLLIRTPFGSNCLAPSNSEASWASISWASSVAFDTLILGLTLYKLRPNAVADKSAVGRQVTKDAVLYFVISTVSQYSLSKALLLRGIRICRLPTL